MVYFSGLSLSLELALGLLIALYFNREFKGSEIVQAIYIFPFAATPVAVALIWRIMLNPEIGVLNYLLQSVGLPGSLWVSSPQTVIPALVMVDVWKWTPMITLIVLAGLKSLPHDPYEAARIDGAKRTADLLVHHLAPDPAGADCGINAAVFGQPQGVRHDLHHHPGRTGHRVRDAVSLFLQCRVQLLQSRIRLGPHGGGVLDRAGV